eukprot:7256571-Ditylum_brightwellii.AAC.1
MHLCTALNTYITNPDLLPPWLTLGQTTLLHKKGPENELKNYCFITCPGTLYKSITLIFMDQ